MGASVFLVVVFAYCAQDVIFWSRHDDWITGFVLKVNQVKFVNREEKLP